ncbi:type 1 glutamine amidotransferase [Nakamurella sp. YIM 132087]|uniref:Type 1 glutamine amidotransferase n=1 Tax=Nakamurella alba TaxID=2665158 RepID=A0A7K1FU11_9ACTN|nr:type 1 glutamine amidotransferase [Nakamurella alba]
MTGLRVLVLEHDASDPPLRVGDWLAERGGVLDVRRLHAGDRVPDDLSMFDAVVSMGGEMGALDDDVAPWLPATRALLSAAVDREVPVLGICLGAQLLAAATGGEVTRGADGPEIGAYLAAKRDAAEQDPLFDAAPMTPDVMHYHYDVISRLPPGAVLLMSSTGYPHQAYRVGRRAWGVQFHIETDAATVREWAAHEGLPTHSGRLGPVLDEADAAMAVVWRDMVHRFADLAAAPTGPAGARGLAGRRLPLAGGGG